MTQTYWARVHGRRFTVPDQGPAVLAYLVRVTARIEDGELESVQPFPLVIHREVTMQTQALILKELGQLEDEIYLERRGGRWDLVPVLGEPTPDLEPAEWLA